MAGLVKRERGRQAPLAPGLRREVIALIDARNGVLAQPVRGLLFGVEGFQTHGVALARAQAIERRHRWWRRARAPLFFPRIAANLHSLERSRSYLQQLDREGDVLGPAGEWLLDNFHLIEAQVPEIRNGLPYGYYRALPKLRSAPLTGLPRVYGIAWAFVAHTDSSFDARLLEQFLHAYQSVEVLTLGELWAVPATLRAVLLENLARLAEAVAGHRAAQEAANWCADQPSLELAVLERLHAQLRQRGLASSFLAQLTQRARGRSQDEVPPWTQWLAAQVPDADALLAEVQAMHAADTVSVSNAVSALFAISKLHWKTLIESVSPVLRTLERSPAFIADSDLTRDQCTHMIERLARRLRCSETAVAELAVQLAENDPAGPARWLIGEARSELVQALGRNPRHQEALALRMLRRSRGLLYAAALMLVTLALLGLVLGPPQRWPWQAWVSLPFAAMAAFECALALVNRMLAELTRVHRLPRLALAEGLAAEQRSLVVIPCILGSSDGVRALADRLEQHYLANPERHCAFALLSDAADAPVAHSAADEALLEQARAAIARLNERHASAGEAPRFLLLHRQRRWSESEGVWMGWERKRGKLEQLLKALCGDEDGEAPVQFVDLGPLSRLPAGVRYLVTLDSDTVMPPGSLRAMVAIAAHPLNRPRLDPVTRRVVAGYSILQPRIAAPLPPRERITPFGWLLCGPWGTDAYNSGSSEVYQDVFGQGSFSGKGLFDVRAAQQALHGRFPEGSVLSHDLLEGIWARSAYLSDVTLFEAAPMHVDVAASRVHRWTRGDWQLLPRLPEAWRGRVGLLNLWKLVDNLRRSLLAPAYLMLIWLAGMLDMPSPAAALLLVAAAIATGPLAAALAGLLPSRRDLAWRHFLIGGLLDLGRAAGGALWLLATLPQQAALQIDAIARALWRMRVSRRLLLQWITADQAEAQASHAFAAFLRHHWGASALALLGCTGAALAAVQLGGTASAWLLVLALLWLPQPVYAWLGSRPLGAWRAARALPTEDRRYLHEIARETWSLFASAVGPDDHHLPPDNLQLDPEPMLAHRTSPTNIGLYLLACACAQRMGYIGRSELAERIERALDALTQLPRYRGHLFNWIDTAALKPLPPAYVSTVDSGNLAALLWSCAQACREMADARPESAPDAEPWQARMQTLAQRLDGFADEMDFSFLYDDKRRLFHIGYRHEDDTLDAGYYDLMASEALLTSYVACAKGDVPLAHWSALGRPFVPADGGAALLSWSGSMFEYLMPGLLLKTPDGGLLQQVAKAAVSAQREFGESLGLPWGVSECAYYAQDNTLAFQYGPFGVPQLALRRTPLQDRVIAPYATMLALQVDAPATLANLRALEQLGARGPHGFIEALDFSPGRVGESGQYQRVLTYMAHHQGMSLLSLCNVLYDDAVRGWFGRAARPRAFGTLLHERMPRTIVYQPRGEPRAAVRPDEPAARPLMRLVDLGLGAAQCPPPAAQPTAMLGNGAYSVWLRPSGAGQSRWRGQTLTRARDDLLRDGYGQWLLLRAAGEGEFHSLTALPKPQPQGHYLTRVFADHVEFELHCAAWESRLQVWVSPDDDIELRSLTLHNLGEPTLDVELLSYFEATLAPARADEAHPAFSNLFVHARRADPGCLLLQRQPHGHGERGSWVAHFLASCDAEPEELQLHADRARLLPRGGSLVDLAPPGPAETPEPGLSTGLDPVGSLSLRLRLPAHAKRSITLATAAAEDLNTLLAIVDEYRQDVHLQRCRMLAATLTRIRHREWQLGAAELHLLQDLSTAITHNRSRPHAAPAELLDRRALWRFGISGDRPLVLLRIESAQGLRVLRTLVVALRLWESNALACDLVVVNGEAQSYAMPLQRAVTELRDSIAQARHAAAERAGIHLLRWGDISSTEWAALHACARIELLADGRPLQKLLDEAQLLPPPGRHAAPRARVVPALARNSFVEQGAAYQIDIDAAHATPRPWANVLANAGFGCIVTESGGGYSWALNSRMNQLTPWSNDPLLDPPGEHFLVEELGSGTIFGLLPSWNRAHIAACQVRHSAGASSFVQRIGELAVQTRVSVDPELPVKAIEFELRNEGERALQLRLLGMVEWIMGSERRERMTLQTEHVTELGLCLARQLEHAGGFGNGTAWLMLDGLAVQQWSCARQDFFDSLGRLQWPEQLDGQAGFAIDPCAALQALHELPPGARLRARWLIGHGCSRDAALALARQCRSTAPPAEPWPQAQRAQAAWQPLLQALQVRTPDPAFDALLNHWLLYQTVACRLWARAGFYQAGGAIGFRDQLQDALALGYAQPEALRAQLLLHASRQFELGDVQHWWHVPGGAGVRTHISDDLLWLPYALTHYLRLTGDTAVLDERVPFLDGAALSPEAEDAYFVAPPSLQSATLYEHAARTLDQGLRFGAHDLPLIGGGDWNDGMNRVGHGGKGESVWLGWFLLCVLREFLPLARRRGEAPERLQRWRDARRQLWRGLEQNAWDGAWFRRAFFDNGNPLGSSANSECRIDLIAQAWSVFALGPQHPRAREAMASADALLVEPTAGLLRLLHPPLRESADHAGYIQAYPPGVRENGGQYTHGAVWALLAQARLGNAQRAWEYFCMLSPAHRAATGDQQLRYAIEPYVMPGDTYTAPPYIGRGGWSWYTGSAAWLYRAAVEALLGLQLRADRLRFKPCLPPHWDAVGLSLRLHDGRQIYVELRRDAAAAAPAGQRRLAVGEWVELAALADGETLSVTLP